MKPLLLALLLTGAAWAESPAAPCEGFAWPMAREKAAFEAAAPGAIPSGTTLGAWPEAAETLALAPHGEADFPLAPGRAPKHGANGGYIVLPAPAAPGAYQVTLSGKAWIDVVQNGAHVTAGDHSSDHACPLMRKSVRFDLVAAPVTLQISGSDATTLTFTILPVAD